MIILEITTIYPFLYKYEGKTIIMNNGNLQSGFHPLSDFHVKHFFLQIEQHYEKS